LRPPREQKPGVPEAPPLSLYTPPLTLNGPASPQAHTARRLSPHLHITLQATTGHPAPPRHLAVSCIVFYCRVAYYYPECVCEPVTVVEEELSALLPRLTPTTVDWESYHHHFHDGSHDPQHLGHLAYNSQHAHPLQHVHTMMMSGGMPPTAGGMGVMGVMGGYLSGGREYLEGGTVAVDPSVWVPPFWDDPHLPDGHLHDPGMGEASHMGEPTTMGDVGPADIMDAFPPQQQHDYIMGESVVVKEEEILKDDYKYKDEYYKYKGNYAKYVKEDGYLKEETPYIESGGGEGGGGGGGGGGGAGVDSTVQVGSGGGGGLVGVGGSPSTSISSSNTPSSNSSLTGSSLHPPLTSPHVQQLSSLCPPFPEAHLTSLSGHKDDPD
ncbi:hypothetical protein Hamer_G001730, partial [Homarus americanus]